MWRCCPRALCRAPRAAKSEDWPCARRISIARWTCWRARTMPLLQPDIREPAVTKPCADIRAWIVTELARALNVERTSIDAAAPLYTLGVDSLTAITLTGALAEWLGYEVPATLMWDHGSIDAIARALGDPRADAPPPGI